MPLIPSKQSIHHRVMRVPSFGPRIASVAFWCACSVHSFPSVLPSYVSAIRAGSLSSTSTSVTTTASSTSTSMTPLEKLTALRDQMKEKELDVWIVPTDDPHLSGRSSLFRSLAHYLFSFVSHASVARYTPTLLQNTSPKHTSVENSSLDSKAAPGRLL